MKKSLLFMAVLTLSAVSLVKAQTPVTWIADTYCTENSFVAEDTALQPMAEITVGDLTFTAQEREGAGWLYKVVTSPTEFAYNGVTYSANYVQGMNNPMKGSPYKDGSPSAAAIFSTASNGTLDVVFKFGYNKPFWVAAIPDDDLIILDLNDSASVFAYAYPIDQDTNYWGGFFDVRTTPPAYYYNNGTPYADITDSLHYTGITLDVQTGYTYYVFFSGSKLMLSGLTFTKAAAPEYSVSGKVTSNATAVEGVLITSSDTKTATTNASGEYSITGITEASIILTPSKDSYTFSPATITLTMDKDYTDQNFEVSTSTAIRPNQISDATVVSSEYFNLIGQKIDRPRPGTLIIVVNKMSDGTVRFEKQYIKE